MLYVLCELILCYRYVAVLVWIPELFSRYHEFKIKNSEDANLCKASEWNLNHSKLKGELVSSEVYLTALIVALITIPFIILTGIFVKYFNKKILLCMYILLKICKYIISIIFVLIT